ncbi:hypothetical protein EV368DRAFT_33167 [Lentinula lateritia]|nr:hypothetical protein EV368DRAFT_33167 [Lentinula lateritia]
MEDGEITSRSPSNKPHWSVHGASECEPLSSNHEQFQGLTWDTASDEWDDSNRSQMHSKAGLRLVVFNSRTLPKFNVAIIDGYPEVQLGRDNPISDHIPRIRLKEMEVSKLHASIYWDQFWDGWGVVDMGSKHGTYLHSGALTIGNSQAVERKVRLSISKTASTPKRLHHLDHLTLGTTVFIVHIHENQLPCEECSPGLGGEISLFATSSGPKPSSHMNVERSSGHDATRPLIRDSRQALSQLKRDLMSKPRHVDTRYSSNMAGSVAVSRYVDRSARRRAMYRASSSDAPGIPTSSQSLPQDFPKLTLQYKPEPISKPAVPIPASSIGYRLLIQQGWHPGTVLGSTERGLIEPLDIQFPCGRSGLGMRTMK